MLFVNLKSSINHNSIVGTISPHYLNNNLNNNIMKRFKSIKELDAYMQSRNYHHINSMYNDNKEEYVREYEHKNGLCSLNYTKVFGAWQNCF